MSEIRSEGSAAQDTQSEETQATPQAQNTYSAGAREPLWGMLLIAGMIMFVIASIAGIGWVAYSQWKSARVLKEQPSILALQTQPNEPEIAPAEPPKTDAAQADTKEQAATEDSTVAAKKLEISVLNGGAAKGSAGVLADFLKTERYSKVIAGNTQKDYTGTVIYYAANLDKEAGVIKASVTKKYPQAQMLPTDATNKETSVSKITIIIGK